MEKLGGLSWRYTELLRKVLRLERERIALNKKGLTAQRDRLNIEYLQVWNEKERVFKAWAEENAKEQATSSEKLKEGGN